jgi:hypothetical protein
MVLLALPCCAMLVLTQVLCVFWGFFILKNLNWLLQNNYLTTLPSSLGTAFTYNLKALFALFLPIFPDGIIFI